MTLWVGTSGFAYKEWKGPFYPEDLPADRMLAYYGERLPAVEINNTFYRMPRRSVLEGWAEQVPDDFRFVLKVSRKVSHRKRPAEAADALAYLLGVVPALGERLGPLLFQTAAWFRKDLDALAELLDLLPEGLRVAFEFRSSTWFDDEVYRLLEDRGLALAATDTGGEQDAPLVRTAPYGYVRLRRETYDEAALADWAERIRGMGWNETFVFFKHEDAGAGPALADAFRAAYPA
ncbi:MAG: DUF72 domain-containing protein [Gemmatimonadetes bacterium]|nr:MAG: DUF72 domain-containing protein [Gemmatimonadota bacterium]